MKKIYLFIILCASFSSVRSQIINRAFHDYDDNAYELTEANGHYYFNSHTYTFDFVDDCTITSIDAAGLINFKKIINRYEFPNIARIRHTLDDKIAFIGYGMPCDYVDTAYLFFMKLDENGLTLFETNFQDANCDGYNNSLFDFIQYPDSSYYGITDSTLYHFDKNGNIISVTNTSLSGQREIDLTPDGNLLVSTLQAGVAAMNTMTTTATILNQYTLNDLPRKTLIKNSYTTYTLKNSISKKDASMTEVVNSSATQPAGTVIRDFCLRNDTIYACGDNPTANTSFVLLMDTSLNVLSQIVNSTKNIHPAGIYVDNTIHMISNCTSQPANNALISYSDFPKDQNYDFTADIGVSNVTMDSAYANTGYLSAANGYVLYSKSYRLKIIVTNFGSTTINNFQLNHYVDTWICGKVFYTKYIGGANLAPGASMNILTDWITNGYQYFLGATMPAQISFGPICFNTSIPNYLNDVNIDNDGACASFTISTVGMEGNRNDLLLNLFPNPTDGLLGIKTDARVLSAFVTDLSGRTILISGSAESIDLRAFEAGIYFVTISTDKGTATRKVVKE
ncbi:MAG: hypothetical protein K0S33_2711 [Bacteroidetes bacterium]|jgi:hypothetical protein|nr:hypothetical protein [Bacteroidota bacterium]